VAAGAAVTGINVALTTAGAIAGTVTASSGGAKLRDVAVAVFAGTTLAGVVSTASNGTYVVPGLASASYTVCFDGTLASANGFASGYTSKCFNNVTWNPTGPPPGGTTLVAVSAGATAGSTNAALGAAPAPALAVGPVPQPAPTAPASQPSGSPDGGAVGTKAASNGSCDPDDLPNGSEGPDDDGDECTFTVHGEHPFPSGGADQAETASGATCSEDKQKQYDAYAYGVVGVMIQQGNPAAATFLAHFLDGTGTPLIFGDGSYLSDKAKSSSALKKYDQQIQSHTKGRWDGGEQDVELHGVNTVSWGYLAAAVTDPELFFAFGGTQGMKINGSATNTRGKYVGDITYEITDTYGWNDLPTGIPGFNNFRPAMNYLQTNCGPPVVAGGPHWFQSGVNAKMPIK
jgi:hypothetical protein